MKHADLTEAQRELLDQCAEERGTYCVSAYQPAKKLVSMGLAEWEDGLETSDWLNITPAGRRALQESDPAAKESDNG